MEHAFPIPGTDGPIEEGVTKREYYATRALPALIVDAYQRNQELTRSSEAFAWLVSHEEIADKAFVIADAMVRASGEQTAEQREIARLKQSVEALQQLQPVWANDAHGGVTAVALASIWQLLGVDNQTDAMAKLRLHYSGPKHGG